VLQKERAHGEAVPVVAARTTMIRVEPA